MATTSILKKIGKTAGDYVSGLKTLAPDESEMQGIREAQANVGNATPPVAPAPAAPAKPYPQDLLHPSEHYHYGDKPGEKRLDMQGNEIKAYDNGGDVRVVSPMIYDDGGDVAPPNQAQLNTAAVDALGKKPALGDIAKKVLSPNPASPKPVGSVGGVKDEALASPMFMPQTNDQANPADMAAPVLNLTPSALPVFDEGGPVDVNDGQHELAILKHGERVLNPKEAEAYRAGQRSANAEGAPADFAGRVLPNPKGLRPMLDTDAQRDVEPISGGAQMNTNNAPLTNPEGDISNPEAADINPKEQAAAQDPHIAQAAAKHYGLEEQPEAPVVKGTAAERKAIDVDKKQAMSQGNLVKLGTALLNERHLSPMPGEPKVYDAGGDVTPTLTPEQIEQQRLAARLADQSDTRGPQPTAKTTVSTQPDQLTERAPMVPSRPQMTSTPPEFNQGTQGPAKGMEQGAAPPDYPKAQFNRGNEGFTGLMSGKGMEQGTNVPPALARPGLKPMVAEPEQTGTTSAPTVGLRPMPLDPKEAYKAKLKDYDKQIQANLDLELLGVRTQRIA